jgi:predicted nuclease with TOPRIM domain
MDVNTFCSSMQAELTGWKAKAYDIVRKIEKLPTGDKDKVFSEVNDLHILIEELNDRISKLQKECPVDWSSMKNDITSKITHLQTKWQEIGEKGYWG